ncbi:MAG: hypothetical protein A2285_09615 [Elusimicrobia bacterium RIFOXYA12_FULL_57_11]|nr:MAG: hypothetical protein A2285_09615 [Elusimicrobia bacterium RIFOXYA12_FULL_57_11]
MPDEINAGAPAQAPGGQQAPETELRAELERVRARGKFFKTATTVFSVLFLLLLAVAFLGYRKVMQTKALLEGVVQGFQPLGGPDNFRDPNPNAPAPLRAVFAPGAAAAGVSGLALLSMPAGAEAEEYVQGHAGLAAGAEAGGKITQAMGKYSDRPLVREFLAELQADPDYTKMRASKNGDNPLTMIASIQKSPGMRALLVKYTKRPEFMKLMMEIMKDPDMSPLLKGMPAGRGAAPAAISPAPAMVPVRVRPALATENSDPDGDGEITFDASAISGSGTASSRAAGKPPPPVDSGR